MADDLLGQIAEFYDADNARLARRHAQSHTGVCSQPDGKPLHSIDLHMGDFTIQVPDCPGCIAEDGAALASRIEPTITHGIARDLPRCQQILEAPLPDAGDGYERAVLILQCERDAGHPGQHRYPGPITWTTPRGDNQ